jgi:hypothetical protein
MSFLWVQAEGAQEKKIRKVRKCNPEEMTGT